jgi:hypothetical protein
MLADVCIVICIMSRQIDVVIDIFLPNTFAKASIHSHHHLYRHILSHDSIPLSTNGDDHISQHSLSEAGLTVLEVVLPLPPEELYVTLRHTNMLPQQRRLYPPIKVDHKVLIPQA